MAEHSIEVVKSVYEGFARRDLPGTLAALADDIEWHEADGLPWGGTQRGPTAVAENVFAPALELVPDLAVTPEEIIPSNGAIAVLQRYTGTAKATGRKLDLAGVGVWNVSEGKIVRYRQFVDTVKFREVVTGASA
jgi:ketosteroid isomerase-like protein